MEVLISFPDRVELDALISKLINQKDCECLRLEDVAEFKADVLTLSGKSYSDKKSGIADFKKDIQTIVHLGASSREAAVRYCYLVEMIEELFILKEESGIVDSESLQLKVRLKKIISILDLSVGFNQ